jgi:hypothetical protein
MTVITAGMGAMKQLKKTLIIHLSTTHLPTLAAYQNEGPGFLDCRPNIAPAFVSSNGLLVDFSAPDLVEVAGAFAQVTLRTKGIRSKHTSRCFVDCRDFKRRTLVITCPS